MNKAELIARIAEENGVSKSASTAWLEAITGTIVNCLLDGETVPLKGLCRMTVKEMVPRKCYNFATKQMEVKEARLRPYCIFSPQLMAEVKSGVTVEEHNAAKAMRVEE